MKNDETLVRDVGPILERARSAGHEHRAALEDNEQLIRRHRPPLLFAALKLLLLLHGTVCNIINEHPGESVQKYCAT